MKIPLFVFLFSIPFSSYAAVKTSSAPVNAAVLPPSKFKPRYAWNLELLKKADAKTLRSEIEACAQKVDPVWTQLAQANGNALTSMIHLKACTAVSELKSAPCAGLPTPSPWPYNETPEEACREDASGGALMLALARKDASQCAAALEKIAGIQFEKITSEKACQTLQEAAGNKNVGALTGFVNEIKAGKRKRTAAEFYWIAGAEGCAKLPAKQADLREECLGRAEAFSAIQAKNPAACRTGKLLSPIQKLCTLLASQEKDACAGVQTKLNMLYCAQEAGFAGTNVPGFKDGYFEELKKISLELNAALGHEMIQP